MNVFLVVSSVFNKGLAAERKLNAVHPKVEVFSHKYKTDAFDFNISDHAQNLHNIMKPFIVACINSSVSMEVKQQ